jgi:hypothetical protein
LVFVILKNHPELPLVWRNENIEAGRGHGCAIDQNLTSLRFLQTRSKAERHRLTATPRAKQGGNLSRLNRETDFIDRRDSPNRLTTSRNSKTVWGMAGRIETNRLFAQ